MQEAEKQFVEIVDRGYNDYQNYPNNLIRFASDHKMRQSMDFRDSSIDEESKQLAIDIIEDAVQNLVDHESATKIIGIFRDFIFRRIKNAARLVYQLNAQHFKRLNHISQKTVKPLYQRRIAFFSIVHWVTLNAIKNFSMQLNQLVYRFFQVAIFNAVANI